MKALPVLAVLVPLAAACGATPPPNPVDSSAIIVPPQPPQPTASPSTTPLATPPPAPLAFKCESGKRFEVGGRSYCGYSDPASWDASERRCVANGGHLLTLESKASSDALHKALGSPVGGGRAAWFGLELKKTKTGKPPWTWITGETVAAASWNEGEPNNFDNNEACGEWLVADGRWNDTRCEMKQPYLCQASDGKTLACKNGRGFSASGFTYCLNAADKSFPEAKRACVVDGGSLAILKTAKDNEAVRDGMAARFSAPRMWIGANDGGEEGTWSWVSGAAFEDGAWLPGEPNNFNREDCAELHADTWQWNDFDCGAKLPSVCESPKKK